MVILNENSEKPFSGATKILIVGDFMWRWYHEACAEALETIGCKVFRFGWLEVFFHWENGRSEPKYKSFFYQVQYRFKFGPTVRNVNNRLIEYAKRNHPDIVWFYNVQLITAKTVKKLRKILPHAIFCQYANDNPFSKNAKVGLWRHFLASIPFFDVHFSYRQSNKVDYQSFGATKVHLLRSYFIPDVDFPVPMDDIPNKYKCDVVFAGHFENDGRIEMLEAICDEGYHLKLFGGGWNAALPLLRSNSPLRKLYPIEPAVGENYRFAICGAKIALCFLSSLNCDTYTRRNFQIPAMKTVMLSQYTEDLTSLFLPDKEAVFFNDKKELLEKLKLLLSNNDLRDNIAKASYNRVYADGHDVKSRMKAWLSQVLDLHSANLG